MGGEEHGTASNLVPVPTDLVLLLVTAVLALTALVVAIVAARRARRPAEVAQPAPNPPAAPSVRPEPREAVLVPMHEERDEELAPRQVDGRIVVPPSDQQVVGAALSRPHIRLAVVLHGVTYALRPESRDRILALMRREYRRRRRERLAAGRRAMWATQPTPAGEWTTQPWMGELAELDLAARGPARPPGGHSERES